MIPGSMESSSRMEKSKRDFPYSLNFPSFADRSPETRGMIFSKYLILIFTFVLEVLKKSDFRRRVLSDVHFLGKENNHLSLPPIISRGFGGDEGVPRFADNNSGGSSPIPLNVIGIQE